MKKISIPPSTHVTMRMKTTTTPLKKRNCPPQVKRNDNKININICSKCNLNVKWVAAANFKAAVLLAAEMRALVIRRWAERDKRDWKESLRRKNHTNHHRSNNRDKNNSKCRMTRAADIGWKGPRLGAAKTSTSSSQMRQWWHRKIEEELSNK